MDDLRAMQPEDIQEMKYQKMAKRLEVIIKKAGRIEITKARELAKMPYYVSAKVDKYLSSNIKKEPNKENHRKEDYVYIKNLNLMKDIINEIAIKDNSSEPINGIKRDEKGNIVGYIPAWQRKK